MPLNLDQLNVDKPLVEYSKNDFLDLWNAIYQRMMENPAFAKNNSAKNKDYENLFNHFLKLTKNMTESQFNVFWAKTLKNKQLEGFLIAEIMAIRKPEAKIEESIMGVMRIFCFKVL